ncbi:EAL domain-containing protein [Acidovorax sp. JG5]|uniref:putative bifunctional diguanylate cyclase/phosphodiesterase n=1 Tax=Acidovorax sp. JG5 TaxID=2822718 RepID=UPI001B32324E|nr:GGDEF and EAL domain-containing protein [Acidovorax sp. JG5]MBP3979420.1 EAL domain-containing protein [Acidovorax sp. JG5]
MEQTSNEEALALAALEAAPDGILIVDDTGTILKANPATELLTGYSPDELTGQSVSMFLPQHMRSKHNHLVKSFFLHPVSRPMGMVSLLQLLRKDGLPVPVDIALGHCTMDDRSAAVVFLRDMTEMKRLQDDMHYQATHDGLTGLVNRWMFMQHFEQAIQRARRSGRTMALLLLDLDEFKDVNDSHGHAAGDQALVEVARRLRSGLRAGDVIARLGGDEFTVLLPDVPSMEHVLQVAQKLQRSLSARCQLKMGEVSLGASIGIAAFPNDAQDSGTLMRFADMAMYAAKAHGRGTHAVYKPEMSEALIQRSQMHERLKRAVETQALELHYQPQVDVSTGSIVGVEALLRWHDPELGNVSPDRFIPVAVSTGLIHPLGDWVLETACRQAAEWDDNGTPMRVSVNLSAQQFRQAQLPTRLQQLLDLHGTRAELIELEITETEAMADPETAHQVFDRLCALGFSIALDDFGTGYSSLSYLRQLPVSRLKIDREFIRQVMHNDNDAVLVRAVIAMAHTLNLPVVAEGVEEAAQLAFLHSIGCETYQGWLFAKALPAADISRMLGSPSHSSVFEQRHFA